MNLTINKKYKLNHFKLLGQLDFRKHFTYELAKIYMLLNNY